MKKLYLLITLFISTVSFGQVVASDGFDYADGSLVPNGGWAHHSGNDGDLMVSSGKTVVQHGTPSEDANLPFTAPSGDVYYGIDFSVDDLGAPYAGSDNEYFAHFLNGTSNFSARLDIVPATGGGDYSVGIASDDSTADAIWATDLTFGTTYRAIVRYNQDSNIAQLWINPSAEGDSSIMGDDQTDPGDAVEAFALRQSDSSENETVRVDDLMVGATFSDVLVFVASTDPTLNISDGPPNGSSITESPELASGATIDFLTTNFVMSNDSGGCTSDSSGDGYIAWDLEDTGTTTTVDSGCIFTSNDGFEYPVTGMSVGSTYLLTARLVDNAGDPLAPDVTYTLTVTVASYTDVADLATLRASTVSDEIFYRVTGEVINTYSRATDNQKFFQDATAGILVHDDDFSVSTVYNEGDGVMNITGTLEEPFGGVLYFRPTEANWSAASSTGNTITPEVVDIATLAADIDAYESELVTIQSAVFTDAGGTFVVAAGSAGNYDITDASATGIFRSAFSESDYISTTIPAGNNDITGLVSEFLNNLQVTSRRLADISASLSIGKTQIEGFAIYPNPVRNGYFTIQSRDNVSKSVEIYDVLGKQVYSRVLQSREKVSVMNLSKGIYILRVDENGKMATRKLIIE